MKFLGYLLAFAAFSIPASGAPTTWLPQAKRLVRFTSPEYPSSIFAIEPDITHLSYPSEIERHLKKAEFEVIHDKETTCGWLLIDDNSNNGAIWAKDILPQEDMKKKIFETPEGASMKAEGVWTTKLEKPWAVITMLLVSVVGVVTTLALAPSKLTTYYRYPKKILGGLKDDDGQEYQLNKWPLQREWPRNHYAT